MLPPDQSDLDVDSQSSLESLNCTVHRLMHEEWEGLNRNFDEIPHMHLFANCPLQQSHRDLRMCTHGMFTRMALRARRERHGPLLSLANAYVKGKPPFVILGMQEDCPMDLCQLVNTMHAMQKPQRSLLCQSFCSLDKIGRAKQFVATLTYNPLDMELLDCPKLVTWMVKIFQDSKQCVIWCHWHRWLFPNCRVVIPMRMLATPGMNLRTQLQEPFVRVGLQPKKLVWSAGCFYNMRFGIGHGCKFSYC